MRASRLPRSFSETLHRSGVCPTGPTVRQGPRAGLCSAEARATRDGPRARLRIVVEDDGPGIGAQARSRSRALQRGVRLDETVPGSGLGPAIVQELVGLYEGSLHLDAAPGGGLRVELDLPAVPDARVHHPPSQALRSSSKAGGLGAGQRRG